MKVVILENIRSAYNVGNIIRTADALGWQVRLTWYTPSPLDTQKVVKTSLGAESNVGIKQFGHTPEAIAFAKEKKLLVVAAEITKDSISLDTLWKDTHDGLPATAGVAVIFWNEIDGVLESTLKLVNQVVHIPMQGVKESLNVGQTSAIFMRACNQIYT
ncbi:MAG: tRNA/rRNA methyltransferase (SpoU) [uncultured bacterium (gcode 4)]|uniref:tRNA/rRNA methyltransferase (SpoU) n=1 Tax=uncultured bacterium (gcode 4) TaxID=1234023 RepID=K1XIQ1_9BACT|nr:MAG: tRNA/rRNA methyltransferase (SpoU) [uncultured bacterium (gcode 4)]